MVRRIGFIKEISEITWKSCGSSSEQHRTVAILLFRSRSSLALDFSASAWSMEEFRSSTTWRRGDEERSLTRKEMFINDQSELLIQYYFTKLLSQFPWKKTTPMQANSPTLRVLTIVSDSNQALHVSVLIWKRALEVKKTRRETPVIVHLQYIR